MLSDARTHTRAHIQHMHACIVKRIQLEPVPPRRTEREREMRAMFDEYMGLRHRSLHAHAGHSRFTNASMYVCVCAYRGARGGAQTIRTTPS
jgi:hypothetical protein